MTWIEWAMLVAAVLLFHPWAWVFIPYHPVALLCHLSERLYEKVSQSERMLKSIAITKTLLVLVIPVLLLYALVVGLSG